MHCYSIVSLHSPWNVGATECNRNDTNSDFCGEYRYLNVLTCLSIVCGADKTVDG